MVFSTQYSALIATPIRNPQSAIRNLPNEFIMCGITGGVWTDPAMALNRAALQRMTDLLAHRGPDDEGYYHSDFRVQAPYPDIPGVALGHRRLAIIDPQSNRQPVSNEDGRISIVFNGEIYNYADLRKRLEGNGHTFCTDGDTETIVHLYEDEGLDFLQHLHGMFAFALWDEGRRRLILARDRLGQKPLVYRVERDRLLFASELKSLLAAPGVPREIDPSAIDEYLTYQYVPHPNSIFAGIRKLPPAHYAVFENRTLTVQPYWSPDFNHEFVRPVADFEEELRTRLTAAVQMRMHSDVPLGAFLSGGVDSSIVVALMQQLSTQPVKTFAIGFTAPEYNEAPYAARVAKHLGTEHREFIVEPSGGDLLEKLIWHYDEPFADSSAIPTYLVSQHTKEHVTVALTGDGGDELFAGYLRYGAVNLAAKIDRLPNAVKSLLAARLWRKLPGGGRQRSWLSRAKRLSAALSQPPVSRYGRWICAFDESERAELYAPEFLQRLPDSDPFDFLAAAMQRANRRDPITQAALADLVTYLPCDLNVKVDIASMAVGLECRQPFLDHRVVELAAGMPIGLKYRRGRGKRILHSVFGALLPQEVFRRPKMGFGVPLDRWFRGELKGMMHEILLDPSTLARGYFRQEAIERLLVEHTTGQVNHAPRLWTLMELELWHRQWASPEVR
jgi:asparagine synthase (glutamine-hydrolysing)